MIIERAYKDIKCNCLQLVLNGICEDNNNKKNKCKFTCDIRARLVFVCTALDMYTLPFIFIYFKR